ncbi:MAG TPA: Gfo/Idh/MocA family oxidoreductase [Planctomycetaceae bacterium]
MAERKVRWGVLSTARIGTEKVIPALAKSRHCEVVAIASRSLDAARQAAARLRVPRAYGSYQELLADPEVEAVYNPLPNHLHVPLSVAALQAGKHVLCEKPIGLSSEEARRLVEEGRRHPRLKLMEAFMYRHHPQWRRAKELATAGGIGDLRTIQSFFSYYKDDPADIRSKPEWGGGGLMDIGCYNISLSRFLFDAEPRRVYGVVEYDPKLGVDRLASGVLEFDRGTSTFTCATQLVPYQRVNVFGTTGRVEIEIPFNAPREKPCRIWHQTGDEVREESLPTCDQYTIQGDLFARSILDDTPVPTPIEDAVANMVVIEAVVRSAKEGRPVEP